MNKNKTWLTVASISVTRVTKGSNLNLLTQYKFSRKWHNLIIQLNNSTSENIHIIIFWVCKINSNGFYFLVTRVTNMDATVKTFDLFVTTELSKIYLFDDKCRCCLLTIIFFLFSALISSIVAFLSWLIIWCLFVWTECIWRNTWRWRSSMHLNLKTPLKGLYL